MKRTTLKRKTPLRRMSKRRQGEYKEYMKLREQFLMDNPVCQVWLSEHALIGTHDFEAIAAAVIFGAPQSTEIHHKCCGKNRKATYLRPDTWMAVSKQGHRFIHDNPKLAYERGWLLKTIPEEPKCDD